jgi:hypothetical protein
VRALPPPPPHLSTLSALGYDSRGHPTKTKNENMKINARVKIARKRDKKWKIMLIARSPNQEPKK